MTESTTVKTAVLAPMPSASVIIAVRANPGAFNKLRSEYLNSASSMPLEKHLKHHPAEVINFATGRSSIRTNVSANGTEPFHFHYLTDLVTNAICGSICLILSEALPNFLAALNIPTSFLEATLKPEMTGNVVSAMRAFEIIANSGGKKLQDSAWYQRALNATKRHFPGWLLTALAVSLGAPFWFDILNKIVMIRLSVKPRDKGLDEGSKGNTAGKTKSATA